MTEQMKKILLSELHKLSPLAQEAVWELLLLHEEHQDFIDAEEFLSELSECTNAFARRG